jgi:hypothetical protein
MPASTKTMPAIIHAVTCSLTTRAVGREPHPASRRDRHEDQGAEREPDKGDLNRAEAA